MQASNRFQPRWSAVKRAACVAFLLLLPAAASAQYEVDWWTVDGGGAMFSTAGPYELSGTIGQPDAGVLNQTDYTLFGGFWGVGLECIGYNPCDTNCDGSVNGFDIEPFRKLLLGTGTKCSPCAGDTTGDGSVNGFDIERFINCLSG